MEDRRGWSNVEGIYSLHGWWYHFRHTHQKWLEWPPLLRMKCLAVRFRLDVWEEREHASLPFVCCFRTYYWWGVGGADQVASKFLFRTERTEFTTSTLILLQIYDRNRMFFCSGQLTPEMCSRGHWRPPNLPPQWSPLPEGWECDDRHTRTLSRRSGSDELLKIQICQVACAPSAHKRMMKAKNSCRRRIMIAMMICDTESWRNTECARSFRKSLCKPPAHSLTEFKCSGKGIIMLLW